MGPGAKNVICWRFCLVCSLSKHLKLMTFQDSDHDSVVTLTHYMQVTLSCHKVLSLHHSPTPTNENTPRQLFTAYQTKVTSVLYFLSVERELREIFGTTGWKRTCCNLYWITKNVQSVILHPHLEECKLRKAILSCMSLVCSNCHNTSYILGVPWWRKKHLSLQLR